MWLGLPQLEKGVTPGQPHVNLMTTDSLLPGLGGPSLSPLPLTNTM